MQLRRPDHFLFGCAQLNASPQRPLGADLDDTAALLALPLPPAEAGPGGGHPLLTAHPKHVLVFSNAGKPVYSYRGDENELAGLMATAHAIMAVAQSRGESLRHVAAGPAALAFLDRGPLRLLAASSLGEPPAVLRMQLALVHGQVASLLTGAGLDALFRRSPGYDVRKLLGRRGGRVWAVAGGAGPSALPLGSLADGRTTPSQPSALHACRRGRRDALGADRLVRREPGSPAGGLLLAAAAPGRPGLGGLLPASRRPGTRW